MTKLSAYTHLDVCKNALIDDNVYNNFKRIPEFTKILEHTTEQYGHEYMKYIFRDYEKYVKYLDWEKLKENDKTGNPIIVNFHELNKISNIKDYNYSPSTIYYIYRGLDIIDKMLSKKTNVNILEIGGGYGGQCKLLFDLCDMLDIKIDNYGIIDLELASKLQNKYLSSFKYQNVEFFEYENITKFDAFKKYTELISIYALSEFEVDVQEYYINNIIKFIDNHYILLNVQMSNIFFNESKLTEALPIMGRYHKLIVK